MLFKLRLLLIVSSVVATVADDHLLPHTGRIFNGSTIAHIEYMYSGSTATLGEFPYQVSLRDKPNTHFCGGSILNQKVILTAAHCVYLRKADNVIVVAGVIKIDDLTNVYEVEALISHENWIPKIIANDIALVKLKQPIQYGKNIKPIEIETNEVRNGIYGIVTGWGLTSAGGQHARDLQYLNSVVLNSEACKKRVPLKYADLIKPFNICGINKVGYGTCSEDSGGPFVAEGKQIGVVSWGPACGDGTADIYAKVSYYADWINSNQ